MGLSGDFGKLKQIVSRLERFAAPHFKRELFQVMAEDARGLVVDAFTESKDPYGQDWKPSRQRHKGGGVEIRGKGQILRDTGRLLNSINSRANANGFVIGTNVVYAAIHNFGGQIHHNAASQFRRYAVGRNDKRKQISLNSKRAKSVRTVASIPEHDVGMPRRMFIPPVEGLPREWADMIRRDVTEAVQAAFQ